MCVRVSGHCFWEKTSNGCKNKDDTFKHNAYDFYALCRKANDPHAEFQCKTDPAKLSAGKCADRKDADATKKAPKKQQSSSGKSHKSKRNYYYYAAQAKSRKKKQSSNGKSDEEDTSYHSYYYLEDTTKQKYCYDCAESTCMHHAPACSWSERSGWWRLTSTCNARRGICSA